MASCTDVTTKVAFVPEAYRAGWPLKVKVSLFFIVDLPIGG